MQLRVKQTQKLRTNQEHPETGVTSERLQVCLSM